LCFSHTLISVTDPADPLAGFKGRERKGREGEEEEGGGSHTASTVSELASRKTGHPQLMANIAL